MQELFFLLCVCVCVCVCARAWGGVGWGGGWTVVIVFLLLLFCSQNYKTVSMRVIIIEYRCSLLACLVNNFLLTT